MQILRSTYRQPYLTPTHSMPLFVQDPGYEQASLLDVLVTPALRVFASPVATRVRIDRCDTRLIGMRAREISAPGWAPITRWNGRRIETVYVGQIEHGDWLFRMRDTSVGRAEITWVQTPRWVLEAAEREGLPIRARIPLTKLFGQWIGIYLSDGWAQHRRGILNSIGLANKADEVREVALVGLEDILEPGADIPHYSARLRDSLTSGWTVELQVKSPALALLLDWLIGHDAEHKHLPHFTLIAPREFREGVFGAGMSCDGGINFCRNFEAHDTATWGAHFTTTSPKVASAWLALGGSLGLTGWICEHRRKNKSRPEFYVGFRHEHIWSWSGNGMVRDSRRARHDEVKKGTVQPTRYSFPTHPRLSELCHYMPQPLAMRNAITKGSVGSVLLAQFLSHVPLDEFERDPELREWHYWVTRSDIIWHRVDRVSAAGFAMLWPRSHEMHLLRSGFSAGGI